jgi:hypothetical protein
VPIYKRHGCIGCHRALARATAEELQMGHCQAMAQPAARGLEVALEHMLRMLGRCWDQLRAAIAQLVSVRFLQGVVAASLVTPVSLFVQG